MAARTKNTQHQDRQQACMRALYPQELKDGRDIFGNFFPQAAQNIVDLAGGVSYQEMTKDGKVVTLKRPPDLNANIYIVNRFLGVPRPENDPILDKLNFARAEMIEKQTEIVIAAQVRELIARAYQRETESAHWYKQYVTEEQQEQQIQSLAEALLGRLMALTPEEFTAITDGKEPGEALEQLKGKIGRDLGEVVSEVMGGDSKPDPDEADDEEEDDDGRTSQDDL